MQDAVVCTPLLTLYLLLGVAVVFCWVLGRYLLWARISSTPSTDAKKQFRQRLARARKQASRTHQPERHKGTRSVPFATQKAHSVWRGFVHAVTFIFCGADIGMCYLFQKAGAGIELLVVFASTLGVVILFMLGVVMTRLWHRQGEVPCSSSFRRLRGAVLAFFRPCQPSRVSFWSQLKGLRVTWSTSAMRQKQLSVQQWMAADLPQDALLGMDYCTLVMQLAFMTRCQELSDDLVEELRRKLAEAERRAAREEFFSNSLMGWLLSGEQEKAANLAQIAHLQQDLAAVLSARTDLEQHLAVKDGCLTTCEAFLASHRDQLAESQQEVQTLTRQLQPLQNAHDWAHRVYTEAALPSLPQRAPKELGHGTFGSAQAAYSPAMGHYVIKRPTRHSTASYFDKEAHHLNLFRHPNVVQYLGRLQDSAGGAVPGILMEKLNIDLADWLAQTSTVLGWGKVLNIGLQLAAGVNAFHSQGYIHGDLKPNNIGYCSSNCSLKVMDLGMVRAAGTYPNKGHLPFNLQYCPPELVSAVRSGALEFELTTAAEVFVFGLILAEVAGADRPCSVRQAHYEQALLNMHDSDSWVQFPINHAYPGLFVDVVADCLKKDPSLRPTMPDVLHRLGALVP